MELDQDTKDKLLAVIAGKPMQWMLVPDKWSDCSVAQALGWLGLTYMAKSVRIKPEPQVMCELAGVQYPMPLDKEPKDGEVVWKAAANGWPESCEWGAGMDIDNSLYHASQIAAEAHSQAILAVNAQAVKAAKEQA